MRYGIPLTTAMVLLAGIATPSAAQSPGQRPRPRVEPRASPVITEVEVRQVRDYYLKAGELPKPLPPGIAKRLARGKPLPPGIARTRLPQPLLATLPSRPGLELLLIGQNLVLVDHKGLAVDLRLGVFR